MPNAGAPSAQKPRKHTQVDVCRVGSAKTGCGEFVGTDWVCKRCEKPGGGPVVIQCGGTSGTLDKSCRQVWKHMIAPRYADKHHSETDETADSAVCFPDLWHQHVRSQTYLDELESALLSTVRALHPLLQLLVCSSILRQAALVHG